MRCPCCLSELSKIKCGWWICRLCDHKVKEDPFDTSQYKSMVGRSKNREVLFQRNHQSRLEYFMPFMAGSSSMLEIGCAEGYFGELVKSVFSRIKFYGVEISKDAEEAKKRIDVVYNDYVENIDVPEMDCICEFHVLEHIVEIESHILSLKKLMHGASTLLIEVPNESGNKLISYDAADEHVNSFSLASLSILLKRLGLDVVQASTNHVAYPMCSDTLRVVAKLKEPAENKESRLRNKFKTLPQGTIVAGLGGDFKSYLENRLHYFDCKALVDNYRAGATVCGFEVIKIDDVMKIFGNTPVLIATGLYEDEIRSILINQGVSDKNIYSLSNIVMGHA